MKKPISASPQSWTLAQESLPFLPALALGPEEIALTIIMTLFTLGSVVIFLEDAVYLYKNTRCPIKRRTLLWGSSAPTVRAL